MNSQSNKVKKLKSKEDFYDILRKYDYDCEIKYTKKAKDAIKIVEELPDDISLVISAGGDGTLNETVTGNMKRKKQLVLANLPMGTTNDVGHMYGLSKNCLKNLELILSGKIKHVDICYINDNPFVYVACLGDYIDMTYNTTRAEKQKYGRLAYVIHGIKELKNEINNYDVRYKIGDGEYQTGNYSFFFITNSSRIAGLDDVYYDIKLNDKMFEVAFVPVSTKAKMLKLLIQLNNEGIKNVPGITYYQTDRLEIEFLNKPKVSWCIDGEEFKTDTNKFIFKIDTNSKMLLPRENIPRLFKKEK